MFQTSMIVVQLLMFRDVSSFELFGILVYENQLQVSSCFHIETTIKQPGFNGK